MLRHSLKRARETAKELDEESKKGFVAQEIASVIPEAVIEEEPETVSVNSELVMAHMVKALQELNEKVDNRVDPHAYIKETI